MTDNVYWILEVAINDGARVSFEALMADMVDATHSSEPGALNYEWFISADGRHCTIYERYRDSAAVMLHLANFSEHFAGRFMAAVTPDRFTIFGPASDEVRAATNSLGAQYFTQIGGFTR